MNDDFGYLLAAIGLALSGAGLLIVEGKLAIQWSPLGWEVAPLALLLGLGLLASWIGLSVIKANVVSRLHNRSQGKP